MVRYHLRCKNSLLLLKRKFLLRVGDKKSFFLLNSRFYFILFIYIVILVFFTKWCYSLEVDVSIFGSALNPGSYMRMHCHYSPWFFSFWTLLCGVYCPYRLVFRYQFYNRSFTAICLATSILQCTSELWMGHWRLCLVWVLLRLVRLLIFYGMFCK